MIGSRKSFISRTQSTDLLEKIPNLLTFPEICYPFLRKVFLTQMRPEDHAHCHAPGSVVPAGHDGLDQSLFQIFFILGNKVNDTGKGSRGVA